MGLCRKMFGAHKPHWEVTWGSSMNNFEKWKHLECMKLGDFSVKTLELEKEKLVFGLMMTKSQIGNKF